MNEFIQPKQAVMPILTPHMEMLIKQEALDYVFTDIFSNASIRTGEKPYQAASELYEYLIGFDCPEDEEGVYDTIKSDTGVTLIPWSRFEEEDFENIVSIMIEKSASSVS